MISIAEHATNMENKTNINKWYLEAARILPPGTKMVNIENKQAYVYTQKIENREYTFIMTVDNNDKIETYVKEPSILHLGTGTKYHTLGNGKICTGDNSISSAYASTIAWAAAYNRYLATGSDLGFRFFDKIY